MDTPPNACRTQPKVMASKISTNSKKTIIAEQKTCFIALNPFIFHLKTDLLYHRHVFSSRSLVLCRRGTMSCFPKHILPALLPPASNRFRQTGREPDRPTDKFCRSAARFSPALRRAPSLESPAALLYALRSGWSFQPIPRYPALSRSFPYTPLCDMECAPPHRQRPTLPGDFACLNPAQRAAVKILTKYNAAHWSGQSEK